MQVSIDVNQLRAPWFLLLDELHAMWPTSDVRIVAGEEFVRVYRDRRLMVNRPTLEAVQQLISKTLTPDGKIKWATVGRIQQA